MIFTFTLTQINRLASKIFELAKGRKVWALHGEMGSGKTTFVHALCENLGVSSAIGSPTYSIINEYKSDKGNIYHIDLYRLKDEEEALQAGVEDCIFSGNICLIEWPERAPSLLPPDCFHLTINILDSEKRQLSIG